MRWALEDTIAALASAPGAGLRGILRISGTQARQTLTEWFQPDSPGNWAQARHPRVYPGRLAGLGRGPIAVTVYDWPTRRSYTGQPLVELHLPGSPPLLEGILAEVYRRGSRPARPGEFTLRAFLAGKLDLLQAEAVLGVIDAQDHQELTVALEQLAGGISGRLTVLRRDLLELLADLEAGLDFIEEDIEFVSRCEVHGRVAAAQLLVDELRLQSERRMQSRSRPRVVLAGLPNAGKSTLFNRLAGREAALVHDRAGTTRDFLEAPVAWAGLEFDLVDTAGWERTANDPIGAAAQQQRENQCARADVILWCSAGSLDRTLREFDEARYAEVCGEGRRILRVLTQMDHALAEPWVTSGTDSGSPDAVFVDRIPVVPEISATTGAGLDDLSDVLREHLQSSRRGGAQWLGMTAARCRESLDAVAETLSRAEHAAAMESIGEELIAVDIREALDHLGRMLGAVYTDDILDRVFSKFCIGK